MKRIVILFAVVVAMTFATHAQAPIFHQDVSWSPDGKYLAFTGMYEFDESRTNFKADIFVMRIDGSELRKISSEDTREFYTSWGKGRIAFGVNTPGTKDSEIYTANPDGSDLRQVTKGGGRNATPSISRDGKRILFVSTRDGGRHQIYIVKSDGSNMTRVTKDDAIGYYNPQWSPDGKRITYYTEKGDGKDQVWVMNADGSNQTLLTANIGHNIFPGWSHDGKKIIFASSKRDADSSGSYVDGSFLYTINPDGSSLMKIGNIKSFFARYSPDGKKIAYIAGAFPVNAIYVANADGSGAVKVTR